MRALLVRELLDDFAGCGVEEVADPKPGPGDLLVRVRAASVNFPDLLMTHGGYQLKPPLPFTPGLDLAGEVAAVGEGVDPARVGEAVVAGARLGAMAQLCVVKAQAARRKPERLSWSEAAAYGAAYLTAWVALVRRAAIRPGERLLVTGAAGGVGLAAVDLGRHLSARVIAGSASDAKLALVAQSYAPEATVNLAPGFRERVKALTDGEGVDVVYDPVGGEVFEEAMRCLAPEARVLVVGFASGRPGALRTDLTMIKQASILGVRAGERGRLHPAQGAEDLAAVDRLAAEGAIRPRVHAAFPIDGWREAFALLARREVVGKAVLEPLNRRADTALASANREATPMLENLPDFVGHALQGVRPGLEKTIYAQVGGDKTLTVTSSAFPDGGAIPARFTEDGEKRSFPIAWSGVPDHAGVVAVVIEDADSPTLWPIVHAIAYDEPGHDGEWPEGALRSPDHEGDGHALGHNSFVKDAYLPPDPPPGHGPHRYVVQVYALKHALGFDKTPGKHDFLEALKGGVIAKGRLIGTYERA